MGSSKGSGGPNTKGKSASGRCEVGMAGPKSGGRKTGMKGGKGGKGGKKGY